MNFINKALLCLPLALSLSASAHQSGNVCEILPENDLWIGSEVEAGNGMTEQVFNGVLDQIDRIYRAKFSAKGFSFVIQREWANGTVNASARQMGSTAYITMYGGLARHEVITPDAFAMVACHEVGHHLGGAPKVSGFMGWASNEGQSDYFATLKCARFMWGTENNIAAIRDANPPQAVTDACTTQFPTQDERALCVRTALAGKSLATLMARLKSLPDPNFHTPDPNVVPVTNDRHPVGQCRLDTYYAGALCEVSHSADLSNNDATVGTCAQESGKTVGIRPLCWYKPGGQPPNKNPGNPGQPPPRRNPFPWPFPESEVVIH